MKYRIAEWIVIILCLASVTVSAYAQPSDEDLVVREFAGINVAEGERLYETGQNMLVPLFFAFKTHDQNLIKLFYNSFIELLEQTKTLGSLRKRAAERNVNLEALLMDQSRGGQDGRKIFPSIRLRTASYLQKRFSTKPIKEIYEYRLAVLQYSYLMSQALKYSIQFDLTNKVGGRSELQQKFAGVISEFLLHDIVKPYWEEVEAWHWSRPFANMRERTEAKLEWQKYSFLKRHNYYRAFIDMDFFLFAIAADLLSVADVPGALSSDVQVNKQEMTLLHEIRENTLKVFKLYLEKGPYFRFQVGLWSDHPDFAYAGCTGSKLPLKPCTVDDVSMDTSHSQRLPWWLRSYRDSWSKGSTESKYYQQALNKLAKTFVEEIVDYTSTNKVLLKNFRDGRNGWFRVRYEGKNWGYSQYTLSGNAARYGAWFILSEVDNRIKIFRKTLCSLLVSRNQNDIEFRTRYYGFQSGDKVSPQGFGNKDSYGSNSMYTAICKMSELARKLHERVVRSGEIE